MSIVEIKSFTGSHITPHLDAVAELYVDVFCEWPYLLARDREHVASHLAAYARSPHSVLVLAFDGARVVGASTGIPLAGEMYALQQPFRKRGIAIEGVFFFGESALLKEYRGIGLNHRFFDERERHARRLGEYKMSAFCAVERALDDARRPLGHHSNEAFWARRGYQRQDDMFSELEWPEIDHDQQVCHRLHFWLRAFEPERS